MIAIGGSDFEDSDEYDEPIITNGHQVNGHHPPLRTKDEVTQEITDHFKFEDLQSATIRGNLDLVKSLLESGEYDVNEPLTSGWTVLMYASEEGHHELVEHFVSLGAEVNCNCQMFYPLMACVIKPYIDPDNVYKCMKLLLEAGAHVNVHDRHHTTPLMMCAKQGYVRALELLCQSKVDINKQDERGWTAAMHAASENKQASIDILLKYHASLFLTSYDDMLMCADLAHDCGHQKLYIYLQSIISPDDKTLKQPLIPADPGAENTAPSYHKMNELELFLNSQELGNLLPLLNEQKVTFEMLLTMNQKDIERLGVLQIGVQQKLLTAIKGVHGSEFEMPDMSQSLYNLELNSRDTSKVMKVYSKHLKYLRATSEYLLRQFKGSSKLNSEYTTNAPEDSGMIENFQNVHEIASHLSDNISRINVVLSEKLNMIVVETDEVQSRGSNFVSYFSCVVLGVGVGVLSTLAISRNKGLFKFLNL